MRIHLSQLKLFVENERRKYPPNASITTHAVAVVDVNFDASYEAKKIDNVNDNFDVGEQKKDVEGSIILPYAELNAEATAINSPPTN
jgi:hypothetical protein